MIVLPENWLDLSWYDSNSNMLLIHLKNDANQYFTYGHVMDRAIPIEDHIKGVNAHDFSFMSCYTLNPDLSCRPQEALDQNWGPVPCPGAGILTFNQWMISR